MWTQPFWKQTVERAIKTAAQVAASLLSATGLGLLDVDWLSVGSVVGLAAVASILTSLASLPAGESGSPSAISMKKP